MEATALRTPHKTVSSISALATEQSRLATLYGYDVLDSAPERAFDNFARMAAHIAGAPAASVTLLDHSRVWRKATFGLSSLMATATEDFSLLALRHARATLLIPDAPHHPDWRAAAFDALEKNYPITFYACAPLCTLDGYRIGAIEVMGAERGDLCDEQMDSLRVLADTVMEKLEIRRALRSISAMHRHHCADEPASRSAAGLDIDLKAPLTSLLTFHDLLKRLGTASASCVSGAEDVADMVGRSARQLAGVASKVPAILQDSMQPAGAPAWINVPELVAETLALLLKPVDVTISTEFSVRSIRARRDALQQVLLNLCSNAFRFIAKPGGELRIALSENDSSYLLYVGDNGPGIPEPRLSEVFALLYDDDSSNRYSPTSRRGLSLVRQLAASMGGSVVVQSIEGVGTTFCVSLPKAA